LPSKSVKSKSYANGGTDLSRLHGPAKIAIWNGEGEKVNRCPAEKGGQKRPQNPVHQDHRGTPVETGGGGISEKVKEGKLSNLAKPEFGRAEKTCPEFHC